MPITLIHSEITHRAVEYFFCAQSAPLKIPRFERLVRWERPYRSWFKLNTDGSAIGNHGTASGGGILRDDSGIWVKGFARNIGTTTSFLAKLWALRDGLIMCLDLQITALEIDLDAKVMDDLMNNVETSSIANASLVADCRHLISQIPQVKVKHYYREVNSCADALARMGTRLSSVFMFFSSPPPNLFNVYVSDLYGLYHPRLCPGPFVPPFV